MSACSDVRSLNHVGALRNVQIRSIRLPIAGFAIALLAACAGNSPRPVRPSTDIDERGFREHIRNLSSDEFKGGLPQDSGDVKTTQYLVEQLRHFGLKPASGASYLQPVPMVEILATDASLKVLLPSSLPLRYGEDMVIWTRREVPVTQLQGSELIFVGYGIVAPEYAWDDYANTDVRGKTVLVLLNDPRFASAMTAYGLWRYKIEEAARHGASGVLLVHEARAAAISWNAVVNTWTGRQLHASHESNADLPIVEGWLSASSASALFGRAKLDLAVLSQAAARSGFKPVSLGLRVDASIHNTIRTLTASNVVAVLPGTHRGREYVLFTAHWDHLFNGARDNASGTAGLLMLAQSLSRTLPKPERSMVFLALAGEESGLLGSTYYVEHPIFPLRETLGVINLDTLHIGGPTRDVTVFGYGNSELEGLFRDAANFQGREMRPDPNAYQGQYYRSSQISFAKKGIPALYGKAGTDDAARGPTWGEKELTDFVAFRHHQPADQYLVEWDLRGTIDDLKLYLSVGLQLTKAQRFPDWYPGSEFRVH